MTKEYGIPTQDLIVDKNGKATKSWIIYFQTQATGDTGQQWSPVATNLTAVGTPTITGAYYQNQGFTDFWIRIAPATSTTSTLGSTYFDLPFQIDVDSGAVAVTGSSATACAVNASTKRLFPPSWTTIATPITLSGRVFSQ